MKRFLGTALCILLAIVSVSCVSNSKLGSNSEEKSWLFSSYDADSVDIKMVSTSVEVSLWNKDEIFVIYESSNGNFPDCYISGTTLLCKMEGKLEGSHAKLKLYMPESFFAEEWKISTVSGSVNASQLWGEECEVTTTSGSVKLEKCEVQELNVNSTSGKIIADNLICSDEADLSTTSGSVRVKGSVGMIDVNTTSGSIEIDVDRPFNGDCCVSSLSGAVRIGMPENRGFLFDYNSLTGLVSDDFTSFRGKGSGSLIYKNGGITIEAETLTGSISLEKRK